MLEPILGDPMGRVTVQVKLENLEDVFRARRGDATASEIRSVTIEDALVDTGCTTVGLQSRVIKQLGLTPLRQKQVFGAIGKGITTVYGTVRLTIMDRDYPTDVFEVPDEIPNLIGQIPLEQLDFVVDPVNQQLIGNPRHGGLHILEAY